MLPISQIHIAFCNPSLPSALADGLRGYNTHGFSQKSHLAKANNNFYSNPLAEANGNEKSEFNN